MKTDKFKDYLLGLQQNICTQLEEIDGKAKFREDSWQSKLGTGQSRVIENGEVFEKGGVNFSHVQGSKLPASATTERPHLANSPFTALGVSLVIHPRNPYVPTTHMNVRCFMIESQQPEWWFGGGYDLTPYYVFEEDCKTWHKTCKEACDPYGKEIYPDFKKRCDQYFYLPHRGETRGIGGLFFDDLNLGDFDKTMALTCSIGDSFIKAYTPIVKKRKDINWGERESNFQQLRRGRYVEFNLVYDRGTLFGLQSGGRTESILMSLPPKVQWHYNWQPQKGSPEEQLTEKYLKPTNWL